MNRKGYFITFEGAEGSGKSTQIRRAAAYLEKKGRKVVTLREPGGTRISEAIRKILLNPAYAGAGPRARPKKGAHSAKNRTDPSSGGGEAPLRPETELLLFLAARAQLVREKILPALRKGLIVVCDRFEDSTLAYQGFGRGIPVRTIEAFGRFAWNVGASLVGDQKGRAQGLPLHPDLTFLLDFDPKEGMKRGGRRDRIERASLAFHARVRRGFLTLARKYPKRMVVLNGRESVKNISEKIRKTLDHAVL